MPTFPFRRSVAQDLRDLFAHDRLRAQTRDLGASSITQGEGSLELRPTDTGTAVVHIGDLPGGGSGVGVPDGAGGWRTVQADAQARADAAAASAASALAALAARVTAAEGRLDSHASRLGAAEGSIGLLQSEISSARGGFGSLGARLNDHVSRIGAAENAIAALQLAAQAAMVVANNLREDLDALDAWVKGYHPFPP